MAALVMGGMGKGGAEEEAKGREEEEPVQRAPLPSASASPPASIPCCLEAYLAPELARAQQGAPPPPPTRASDVWSLGVLLFALLSGGHVPWGHRGLCWTSVPNMPGSRDSIDRFQDWLEEHLLCKVGVMNQIRDKGQ
ncbi:hypothetical protein H632_c5002p0, partial [Helicosporidium sp. ATCC 50920]